MSAKVDLKTEGARSFAVILSGLGGGDHHEDISEEFHKLTAGIRAAAIAYQGDAKVKGSMTLKFNVACDARGTMEIDVDIATKIPRKKRAKAHAWVTKGGNLTFEHPQQEKLPLYEVPKRADIDNNALGNDRDMTEV